MTVHEPGACHLPTSVTWVQATLALTTTAIPTSGVLDIALLGSTAATPPYDAVAAVDSFMLTARDWVGQPGRQLQYEFRALQVCLRASLGRKMSEAPPPQA